MTPLLEAMRNHWPNRLEGARDPTEWFTQVVAKKGREDDAIGFLAKTDELYEGQKGKELENEMGRDNDLVMVVKYWNQFKSGKVNMTKQDVVTQATDLTLGNAI